LMIRKHVTIRVSLLILRLKISKTLNLTLGLIRMYIAAVRQK